MSTPDAPHTDPQQRADAPTPDQPAHAAPVPPPYGAPYGAPAQPPYVVPQQPTYTAPPAQGVPAQPPYGAPAQPYPVAPQYGPPGAPQYGAPQYGAPGAYGYPPPKPSTGTLSWALGFLIFISIPFLSGIVSGVVMASVYRSVSRKGEIARQNARSAANWALTYLTVSIALLLVHIIVLVAFAGDDGMTGFFPLGIPITLYFAVSILHVVLVIVGTVKASSGKVLRVPFAIPYIRP